MSTEEPNTTPESPTTREVTLTVPEHRAEQFLALARQVLAVWEYRDRFGGRGFPGHGPGRRGRHGRHGAHRGPGSRGRCAGSETKASGESVTSA